MIKVGSAVSHYLRTKQTKQLLQANQQAREKEKDRRTERGGRITSFFIIIVVFFFVCYHCNLGLTGDDFNDRAYNHRGPIDGHARM